MSVSSLAELARFGGGAKVARYALNGLSEWGMSKRRAGTGASCACSAVAANIATQAYPRKEAEIFTTAPLACLPQPLRYRRRPIRRAVQSSVSHGLRSRLSALPAQWSRPPRSTDETAP